MKGFDMGGEPGLGGGPTSSQGLDMGEKVDSLPGNIELEVEAETCTGGSPGSSIHTKKQRQSLEAGQSNEAGS